MPALAAAAPRHVRVWDGGTPDTTEALVTLGAPTVAVYDLATDYTRWERLFSDVSEVEVQGGSRRDARVRFASRAVGHTITVRFDNDEARAIRFVLTDGPPGAEAWGRYMLSPSRGGETTVVRASLYMDVTGVPGWFVSDETLRRMRARKLRTDLEDLARRFPID